jgi:hypothetical protein
VRARGEEENRRGGEEEKRREGEEGKPLAASQVSTAPLAASHLGIAH